MLIKKSGISGINHHGGTENSEKGSKRSDKLCELRVPVVNLAAILILSGNQRYNVS